MYKSVDEIEEEKIDWAIKQCEENDRKEQEKKIIECVRVLEHFLDDNGIDESRSNIIVFPDEIESIDTLEIHY